MHQLVHTARFVTFPIPQWKELKLNVCPSVINDTLALQKLCIWFRWQDGVSEVIVKETCNPGICPTDWGKRLKQMCTNSYVCARVMFDICDVFFPPLAPHRDQVVP
jgi:hypothetical protein